MKIKKIGLILSAMISFITGCFATIVAILDIPKGRISTIILIPIALYAFWAFKFFVNLAAEN